MMRGGTEITPVNAAKKNALFLMSGNADADERMVKFGLSLLREEDNCLLMHYQRGATSTVYGPGRIAGSFGVSDESVRERRGVVTVPLSDEVGMDDDARESSGHRSRELGRWVPEGVRAELSKRRAVGKGSVHIVQIDGMSGKFSVEECVAAICEGEFSSSHSSYANDEWISIPKPDLLVMGCRGRGLVRRSLLGSVTQNVLNRIPVSTCFYRSSLPATPSQGIQIQQRLGSGANQRVVCIAMSGSNSSRRLVDYFVESYANPTDVVLLLHCLSDTQRKRKDITHSDIEENMARAFAAVEDFQKEHAEHKSELRGRVIRMTLDQEGGHASDVRDRIVDFLEMTDTSLLVVGRAVSSSHLRSKFMSPFPQYCVNHASCPVLVWNPEPTYVKSASSGAEAPSGSGTAA